MYITNIIVILMTGILLLINDNMNENNIINIIINMMNFMISILSIIIFLFTRYICFKVLKNNNEI